MSAYRRSGEQRGPLRDVYVARTTKVGQRPVMRFLGALAYALGPRAEIRDVASTHLTFLESFGVKEHFRNRGFTPADIRTFKGRLDARLKEKFPIQEPQVDIDPARPLRWIAGSVLALNVVSTSHLVEVREAINGFLVEQFGVLPEMRSFDPHITIGRVWGEIDFKAQEDANELIPKNTHTPRNIALNGLAVYLGRIE